MKASLRRCVMLMYDNEMSDKSARIMETVTADMITLTHVTRVTT